MNLIPSARQSRPELGELNEGTQRPRDPCPRVCGEAVRADQGLEILNSGDGQSDSSHALQLVERDRLAGCRLRAAKLRASERAGNAVQQLGDVTSVRISIIDRHRQKRSGDCSRLDVHPVRKPGELLRLLVVKGDVQTLHQTHFTR